MFFEFQTSEKYQIKMDGPPKKRQKIMDGSSDKRQRTMFEFFQPKQDFPTNKRQRTMFEFFQPKQGFTIPCLSRNEVKDENSTKPIKVEEKYLQADSNTEDTVEVGCFERNKLQLDTEETDANDDSGENDDISHVSAKERPCTFHCSYDDDGNFEKISCNLGNIYNNHGEIKTFFCPICGRRTQKGALTSHVLNHNEMKFECSEENCGWMFEVYSGIKAHFVFEHNKLISKVGQYGYRVDGEIEYDEKECSELVNTISELCHQ